MSEAPSHPGRRLVLSVDEGSGPAPGEARRAASAGLAGGLKDLRDPLTGPAFHVARQA